MGGIDIMDLLFDAKFLATAAAAVFAFATFVTLGLPLLERDTLSKRLKSVAARREELRARHKEMLSQRRGASLRAEPIGSTKLIKQFSDRFDLAKLVASEGTQEKLSQAGLRGPTPLMVFNFFRFVMPFVLFAFGLLYFFVLGTFHWAPMMKLAAAVAAALVGYYLPDLFISNVISRRQQSIMAAFPDALDLLLICVESGMSVEAGFQKVAGEIGHASAELAEEFALTTAELSYLPDRKLAFENLAKRCGHAGVKAVATALNQAERYGTPLGQALRICAQENRDMRMMEAEKKAAALPAKLTVPMILFFLPVLFVVIMGPAVMRMLHMIH
ncbi:type II secretion system F family protein [Rhizomicrobium electricum]|uniref:Type II secretion system F family protein n=1 Tax=Rhizomicrobium electricum TaxID=480070 RepID=A0ABN1F4U2_9PROT|nr:tight adherence protein C [Rhizomicrobium electricum]